MGVVRGVWPEGGFGLKGGRIWGKGEGEKAGRREGGREGERSRMKGPEMGRSDIIYW